jgi:xanthine/CO dehydrogenase XdhC/CoxF family maturation factor
MRIFLQPLRPDCGYRPFAAIAEVLAGDNAGVAATVLQSEHQSLLPGATLVLADGNTVSFGIPDEHRELLAVASQAAAVEKRSYTRSFDIDGRPLKVLIARLLPPPRILILGAERGNFASAEHVLCVPADRLAGQITLSRYDAAIVMSHHLATDRKYLGQLADSPIPYIGLLGPEDRRKRLLEDLGAAAERLQPRLQGPAGFDIGADGPASIALSILAEMHAVLKGKPL